MRCHPAKNLSGMTLTEVLVAVALLAVLAVGIAPSVGGFFSRGQVIDVQGELLTSWQMARATAVAGGRPVLWRMSNDAHGTRIAICRDTSSSAEWSLTLDGSHLHGRINSQDSFADSCSVAIAPHGLAPAVEISFEVNGHPQTFTLPSVAEMERAP